MEHTNTRRGLRTGMVMLAILGAALLLCSTLVAGVGAGIAVAQEQEYQQQPSVEYSEGERDAQGEAEPAMDDNDDDVPVKVVYRGYGFALNANGTGTEFHALPLRVNIIRVRQLEPIRIRELMEQNWSIDEIRGEIMEKACAPTYHGYMQFAGTHYKLVNISVNYTSHAKDGLAVNNVAIDANIIMVPVPTPIPMPMPMPTPNAAEAELKPMGNGNENASAEKPYQSQGQDQSAGNISLNVLNLGQNENFITIGEGKLTIRERGDAFQFQYHVLLRSER